MLDVIVCCFLFGDCAVISRSQNLPNYTCGCCFSWGDVVGVEWGSSWPPATPGGEGGGSGKRDPEVSSYELYYTVPDDLRRPWQVQRRDYNVQYRSPRRTKAISSCCLDLQ